MSLPIYHARFPFQRRLGAALLSFSLIGATLCAFGCASSPGTGTGVGGVPTASGGSGDAVIATVNQDPILESEVYDQLQRFIPSRLQGYPNNPALNEPAGRYVLQSLITNKIIVQAAKAQNAPVTADEVDARYNDLKMVRESQSTQTFEQALTAEGFTVDSFKQSTIVPEIAQYNLLTHGVTGTAQEFQAYYNSHQADYTEPPRAHLERVEFPSQAAAAQAYVTASKAKSLAGIIPANLPTPPGADSPADIPQWIGLDAAPAPLKPVVAQVAKSAPGTILAPTQVQGQWWVTRVVDVKPKTVLKYDQLKHIIEWTVLSRKAQTAGGMTATQAIVQKAQQNAQIQINPPQYQSLVPQIKAEASAPGGQQ